MKSLKISSNTLKDKTHDYLPTNNIRQTNGAMTTGERKICGVDCGCNGFCQRPPDLIHNTQVSPIEANTQEIDHDGKLGLPWFLQPYTDRYTNIIRPVKNPGMIVASCSMSRTQAEFIVEQCNKLYESYKTQESQTDLWNDLINLYDTTDRSSYGYASLVKALSEKFILTRRNP